MFQPQAVAAGSAQLVFATPGNPLVVPDKFNYLISAAHVSNVGSVPVSLKVWRVPSGLAADAAHLILPSINIPVATNTFPYFDLTTLWGVILQPGDSIYAEAGVADALVIHADGAVISI